MSYVNPAYTPSPQRILFGTLIPAVPMIFKRSLPSRYSDQHVLCATCSAQLILLDMITLSYSVEQTTLFNYV